jgi:acetyl esterase/lipase
MGFLPRPIDLINKSVGLAGVKITRGIAYGNNPRQVLDIYTPAGAPEALPVVVFFYGGSWQNGARRDYGFIAGLLAAKGFMAVVPDYRIFPETRYPGFIEDCAGATEWVIANIPAYGGDAKAVFLMGHSAGAYNAVMVALAPHAPEVAGVIGLAGPYDFLPLKDPAVKAVFAGPSDIRDTQPITHAHGAAPPMFLLTGAKDRTVLPRNTTALAAKIRLMGGVVETKIYPKLGHIGLLLALLPYLAWRARVWKDVLDFCAACRAGEFALGRSEIPAPMVRRSL